MDEVVLSVLFVVLVVGVVQEARRRFRRTAHRALWIVGGVALAATLNIVEPVGYGWLSLSVAMVLFAMGAVVGVSCLVAAARLGRASPDRS